MPGSEKMFTNQQTPGTWLPSHRVSACPNYRHAVGVLDMWIVFILLFFCVLTLGSVLPASVVVILAMSLAGGLGASLWFGVNRRAQAAVVVEPESAQEIREKVR
jgi:hypothetical protein